MTLHASQSHLGSSYMSFGSEAVITRFNRRKERENTMTGIISVTQLHVGRLPLRGRRHCFRVGGKREDVRVLTRALATFQTLFVASRHGSRLPATDPSRPRPAAASWRRRGTLGSPAAAGRRQPVPRRSCVVDAAADQVDRRTQYAVGAGRRRCRFLVTATSRLQSVSCRRRVYHAVRMHRHCLSAQTPHHDAADDDVFVNTSKFSPRDQGRVQMRGLNVDDEARTVASRPRLNPAEDQCVSQSLSRAMCNRLRTSAGMRSVVEKCTRALLRIGPAPNSMHAAQIYGSVVTTCYCSGIRQVPQHPLDRPK